MAVRTMDMFMRHLRDNAAAWTRFLRAPPEPENLPSKLLIVGAVTCGVAACAAVSPQAQADGVQLAAAVLAFISGLCVIWGAFWVAAAAAPRRGAVGQIILYAALVFLLIAISLSGSVDDAEFIFHTVFDAIQA